MKGRISKRLESILKDSAARGQLQEHLIRGRDGRVTVAGRTYTVRTEARHSPRKMSDAPAGVPGAEPR